jgi:nucleoside-diphosphate-sugar epimerase
MSRILIAGCGYLGTALGHSLHASGHEVWGLKRQPRDLPSTIRSFAADLTDPSTLTQLPQPLDYVIYSAAATSFSEAHYQSAYYIGVRNILSSLQKLSQQPQRFLFISSTSVYDQHQGEWVDEDTPAQAEGFSGYYIRKGEELVLNNPLSAVIVRFGGIYGPDRSRLIDSIRNGSATTNNTSTGGIPIYTNRIHRDDCVRVLEHLIYLPIANLKRVYIAVDNEPAPLNEVICWIASQLGISDAALQFANKKNSNIDWRLRANKRCLNTRLRDSGFQFLYPSYREGYSALLAATNNI